LEGKGFQYQDLDVTKDKAARDEMINRSKQFGVPVIDIDGELIIGFNEPKLKEKLGIKD
jgi:glutaredoxin